MRKSSRAIFWFMCMAFCSSVMAEAPEPCSDPSYSWQKLDAAFQKAKAPARQGLVGKWINTGYVMTKEFKGGNTAKDTIQSDCNGLKRDGKIQWTLEFHTAGDHLVLDEREVWLPTPKGLGPYSSFESDGTLLVDDLDDTGDVGITYRCRMADPNKLICVYRGAAGWGVEFQKQATEK